MMGNYLQEKISKAPTSALAHDPQPVGQQQQAMEDQGIDMNLVLIFLKLLSLLNKTPTRTPPKQTSKQLLGLNIFTHQKLT